MSKVKKGYKYCIVPMCKSTLIKTPNKVFFYVPLQNDERQKWCKAMMRDVIGPKSKKYVCEDHFDLENDMANYVKYKLVGGPVRLKDGVVPHKFYCQNDTTEDTPKPTHAKSKTKCKGKVLSTSIPVSTSTEKAEFADCGRFQDVSENMPKETSQKMLKINASIIGYNVNGICVGCLNYNRKMYFHEYVNDCFKLLGNIEMPKGVSVQMCWECLAAVRAVRRFQAQMLKSYDILVNYSKRPPSSEQIQDDHFDRSKTKSIKRKRKKELQHPFSNSPEHLTSHATTRLSITTEIEHTSTHVDKQTEDNIVKIEQDIEQDHLKLYMDSQIDTEDKGFFYEDCKRHVSLLDKDCISRAKRKKSNIKQKKSGEENSECTDTTLGGDEEIDFKDHLVSNAVPLHNNQPFKIDQISTIVEEQTDCIDVVKNEQEDISFNVEQYTVKIKLEIEENCVSSEDHNLISSSISANIKEENNREESVGYIESNLKSNEEVVVGNQSVSDIAPANTSHFAYEILENVIKASKKTSLLINRGGSLNTKQRYLLSRIIAKEILKYSKTGLIRYETYNKWTQAVTQMFPEEKSSTFFIPGLKTERRTNPPRGMLVRECVKERRKLKRSIAMEKMVKRLGNASTRNINLQTED